MIIVENLTICWPSSPNVNFPLILQVDKSRRLHGTFPSLAYIAENYRRLLDGRPLINIADRVRAY